MPPVMAVPPTIATVIPGPACKGARSRRSARAAGRNGSTTPLTSSTISAPLPNEQKENLQGTIEFYQARTNTELTIAAERLAVIAAITLPVTAVSSILGMNLIVNDTTQPVELAVALLSMIVMSVLLLIWAKRQGWF